MIIVDTALEQRERDGKPIRIALIGAGYMGRGIARQIIIRTMGMRLVGISSRSVSDALRAYSEAGIDEVATVESVQTLEDSIASRGAAVTEDPLLLCRAANVDAIVDVTGDLELGARMALEAFAHGKHVILLNAELDATVGPILKTYADRAGVVVTYSDGDEPGVAMNLYRTVRTMGFQPVMMGQIKGFLDRYRNPDTQRAFAEQHSQKPASVAAFADGSKLNVESTMMANATGFTPVSRGMRGPQCAHVKDMIGSFSADELLAGGLVDYALGAEPHSGAFVVGYAEHPIEQQYLRYFKMGNGPFYLFYTPFHLPHLQLPASVARAVLFHDATLTPRGAPVCETGSFAKRDLAAGETLDGMGGFTCYGLIDIYDVTQSERLLPIVLSAGCVLTRDIPKDQPVTYADVELPAGRLADQLYAEQVAAFPARSV